MTETNRQTEPKTEKPGWKKRLVKGLGILLSLVILYFLLKNVVSAWDEVSGYLAGANWLLIVLSILIYSLVVIATGQNWGYLIRKLDGHISAGTYLDIHMTSMFARYIPGGIWSIVGKAYLCRARGANKSATTASIILEYVYQIISSGLFLLFFLPVFFQKYGVAVLIAAVVVFLAVLLLLPWLVRTGVRLLARIFKEDLGDLPLSGGLIYMLLFRYAAVWLLTGLGLIVWAAAFDDLSWVQAAYLTLSYPICWVAGFLSPSPNGLGVREGVLQLLLSGIYESSLLALLIVTTRLWTIVGEVLSFGIFKPLYLLAQKKRMQHEKEERL